MAVELAITFPLGRYHATPWGRSANEGEVEWPPSPFRILRALYATWKNRVPDLSDELVLGLLDELCVEPHYLVPAHAGAHTRHYLPGTAHREGVSTDTTKVIDAFVSLPLDGELVVRWEIDLAPERFDALATLADHLSYLGRAESICTARARVSGDDLPPGLLTALPLDSGGSDCLDLYLPERPLDEVALTVTTAHLRGSRKSLEPPGVRRVRYPRPIEARRPSRQAPPDRAPVDAVRWALVTNTHPSTFAAVAWTDTLRRASLSVYGGRDKRAAPPVLSGKSGSDGRRAEEQHQHVHWLALPDGERPYLTSVVAWAPAGFDDDVLDALTSVRHLSSRGIRDVHSAGLAVEGYGRSADVLPEVVGPSRVWRSLTPFAPSRHQHRNQGREEFLFESVNRELHHRSMPEAAVSLIDGPWPKFRSYRPNHERLNDQRRTAGLELRFAEPVQGPVCLGALSHFGLGLFVPFAGPRS